MALRLNFEPHFPGFHSGWQLCVHDLATTKGVVQRDQTVSNEKRAAIYTAMEHDFEDTV